MYWSNTKNTYTYKMHSQIFVTKSANVVIIFNIILGKSITNFDK